MSRVRPQFLAAALLASTCALSTVAAADRLPIVDVHTHPEFTTGGRKTEATFNSERQRAGVVFAVGLLHTDNGELPNPKAPDTIYCAGVHASPNLAGLEKGLTSRDYRCIKIYLGYTHKFAYDEVYDSVYKLAEKYDVPVIFHTGDTDSPGALLKYADPLTIDEVAVKHPHVRFVLAHSGNPWIESAAEVAYKNPNVYLDGSAFLVGNMSKLPRSQVDRYMVQPLRWIFGYVDNPDKLMFGTDWPLVDMPSYVEAFKRAIPKRYWRKVFHDNAVLVFKINELKTGR